MRRSPHFSRHQTAVKLQEKTIAARPNQSTDYWFRVPRDDRIRVARLLEHLPIGHLPLEPTTLGRLAKLGFATVGEVLLVGPEIADQRLVGTRTLAKIDAVLRPMMDYAEYATEAGSDIETRVGLIAHGLSRIRDLGDYSSAAWLDAPLPPRAVAALAFTNAESDLLRLPDEIRAVLAAANAPQDPGRLLFTGREDFISQILESAATTSLTPEAIAREVHDALRAAAADRLEGLDSFDTLAGLHDRLAARSDLAHLPVQELPWPVALCSSLVESGHLTLADAVGLGPQALVDRNGGSSRAMLALIAALQLTVDLPPAAAGVDWARLWRAAGIRVVPEGLAESEDMSIGRAAHLAIREVVRSWLGETDWRVLRHRYGLLGWQTMRLQQLGDELGVTRQRVQQREARAVRRLGEVIESHQSPRDWPKGARMHPAAAVTMEQIMEVLSRAEREFMHQGELRRLTAPLLQVSADRLDPLVRLLADASGLKRVSVASGDAARVWLPNDVTGADGTALESAILRVHTFLTGRSNRSYTELELTEKLNEEDPSAERLKVSDVIEAARLCSTVERTRFGEIRGRTAWLARRDQALERLLADAGEPMHITQIVARLNAAYEEAGRKAISLVTAGNYLSASDSIEPIGKSGFWALTEWDHVETGTILELMERCLEEHGEPMTADEVYAHVSARRPVRQASIISYLTSERRFAKIDHTRYGLATWPEAADVLRWNKTGLAAFVAGLFSERATEALPYRDVARMVEEASGLGRQSVRGMLATNPVIKTKREPGGVLMAHLQPDYEAKLDGRRRSRRREGTLAAALADLVHRILAQQPGHSMPLAELRTRVLAELPTTKGTFYSYVDLMPDVEKVPMPGSRQLSARLVEPDTPD